MPGAPERRQLGKLVSALENGPRPRSPGRATGHARIIGVTRSPGVGKSPLTDRLVAKWRRAGQTVAVVAIAPSSPLAGGALLGDRLRMQRHSDDPGVFIRSLAARGSAS